MYIETKLQYVGQKDGEFKVRKITESYLVDALTFTEAEARIIEERRPYISGDFQVKAVKITKISEIFDNDGEGDKYWLVKWKYDTLESPKNGAETKKIKVATLVRADDAMSALKAFDAGMKGTLADYDVTELKETQILELYMQGSAPEG